MIASLRNVVTLLSFSCDPGKYVVDLFTNQADQVNLSLNLKEEMRENWHQSQWYFYDLCRARGTA